MDPLWVAGGLFAVTFVLAAWQAGSWLHGLAFTGALVAAAARVLMRAAGRPRHLAKLWMRHARVGLPKGFEKNASASYQGRDGLRKTA